MKFCLMQLNAKFCCFSLFVILLSLDVFGKSNNQDEYKGRGELCLSYKDIIWRKTNYLVRGCKTVKIKKGSAHYAEIGIPDNAISVECPMVKTHEYVGIAFYDAKWDYMGCAYNRDKASGTHISYRIPKGAKILRYAYENINFDYIKFIYSIDSDFFSQKNDATKDEVKPDQYRNPVIRSDMPDPTIIHGGDGYYYCIATGCRTVYRSRDLVIWEDMKLSLFPDRDKHILDDIGKCIWAPDLAKVGSHFLLYLSLWNSNFDCSIVVCKAEKPYGPFMYAGVLTSADSNNIEQTIDPEFVLGEDGRKWLFFGSNGGIYRVQLADSGLRLIDSPHYEHVAGLKGKDRPSRESVFEGSYLYKHGGYWYLFLSYGSHSAHYGLKVGRSKNLLGVFKDKEGRLMKEGFGSELLSSELGDKMFDPGHCGEIFTDKHGKTYMFYHCHIYGISRYNKQTESCTRTMCLQELLWDKDGWPYFEGGKPQLINTIPQMN